MKEEFDPNRAYNRDAINKAQKIRVRLMDEEALNRGRKLEGLPEISDKKDFDRELILNPQHKVFIDVYTGKIIRGGDAYDFEHILSANYLYMKLRGTHTDEEIAKIVNNPKNVGVTRRDINIHKKQHNLKEYILDHNEKVERFGIDENLAKKKLIEAENSIDSLSKVNIPKSYDNSKSECKDEPPVKPNQFNGSSNSSSKSSNSSKGLRLSSFLNSFSVPKTNIKLILVILAIIILLLLFLWIKDIFPFEKNDSQVNDVPQTELVSDKNDEFETKTIDEESTKSKLGFAEPLEDLTKSVTDISEFNSIVENHNIIPVIGSLFDYNSTDISTNGKAVLTRFVNEYTNLEVPVKIIIEGFTCTIGSAEYNQILGEKRANNLKTQLIDLGVDENIIVIKPIGKQNFVSTNNGENDLILNRRSNVTIIRAD